MEPEPTIRPPSSTSSESEYVSIEDSEVELGGNHDEEEEETDSNGEDDDQSSLEELGREQDEDATMKTPVVGHPDTEQQGEKASNGHSAGNSSFVLDSLSEEEAIAAGLA